MLHAAVAVLSVVFACVVSPLLLERVTERSHSPRGGALAWLALCAAAVLLAFGAVAVLAAAVLPHHEGAHGGHADHGFPAGYAWQVLLAVLVCAVAVRVGMVGASTLRRNRAVRERHLSVLRVVGRGSGDDYTVLEAGEPAVYCIRPDTIVVTTGALDALSGEELAAVLAHERAHLSGRHHDVLAVLHVLRRALPFLPVFPKAEAAVACLFEVCADDVAARQHGRRALATALARLTCRDAPASSLAASGPGAVGRVTRLLRPPGPWARQGSAVGLLLCAVALVLTPLATSFGPSLLMVAAGRCPFSV